MPDVLFVISGTKLGVFKYSDVAVSYEHSRFITEGRIPRDAKVIGTTWQYVNRDGTMDKRFNNNREIPICRFSQLKISSPLGLNAHFMFSRE